MSETSEQALKQAESLLERLEQARAKLENTEDPEAAMEVMSELAEIARQVEAAIAQAKREADADA